MNEECMHAHEVISMAYDGETVAPEELRAAKTHCATCPECAAFVGGLAKIRAVPAPQIPIGALDRALDAVRSEAARALAEAQAADETRSIAEEGAALPPVAPYDPVPRRRLVPAWNGWVAAAAGIVVVVGVMTVVGLGALTREPEQVAYVESDTTLQTAPESSQPGDPGSLAGSATGQYAQDSAKVTEGVAPPYVVYQSIVYRVTEDNERRRASMNPVGQLTSDMGTGSPALRAVYSGEAGTILVETPEGDLLVAEPVVRTLNDVTYVMRSNEVALFGSWPTLIAGLEQPTNADGSPQMVEAGEDDEGVTIYTPVNADTSMGFAVAPGTADDDPAAGNPYWTWWTAAQ